ncbi:MAG: endonuclease VII domain-containing protein [Deltaproteobacteria bacterium]|nr:endonuclease VII domain-containing protein [Deltaproteobacteria bacterium]
MEERQGGVCAICGDPETNQRNGRTIRLSIDHDHETGQVRGLLCVRCNTGLGLFGDNIEVIQKVVDYLSRS